ncbi:MAG: endonuclease III [Chloroflexi bacterium]|nr:endonuclease III [Chloroflexota bacterium]
MPQAGKRPRRSAALRLPLTQGRPAASVGQVYERLEREYGAIRWVPRYDPISELVLTVLSQHTSDVNAKRAFCNLLDAFGSWERVAQASPEEIGRLIYVGGLSRVKAPRIREVLRRIQEMRGSLDLSFLKELPLEEAKEWLCQLPGVGPKTAAVVLCFSLGMPAFPVDTHVHRVSRRLGLVAPGVNADRAHRVLEEAVPPERRFPLHVYLITHGRRVCKAPRPRCEACVLADICPSSLVPPAASR